MSRRLAPAAGSARSFSHSPKPPYGAPATRLRVSSPARTPSTTTFGGVTYDVARQILMGHGRCVKIWPQLRLTKAWSQRAEARGSCRALDRPEDSGDDDKTWPAPSRDPRPARWCAVTRKVRP